MPKLIQINTVCNNSSGHIMEAIQKRAQAEGWETLTIYGRRKGFPEELPSVKCGNGFFFWLHVALTTAFDLHGLGSILPTRKMIRILRKEQPDIIQLHNIHGYYLNYPMLFRYLKDEFKGHVVWTLHDCWAYTGHCAFFTVGCDRWKDIESSYLTNERTAAETRRKTQKGESKKGKNKRVIGNEIKRAKLCAEGCYDCPHKKEYPWSFGLDNSRYNWHKKKDCFRSLPCSRMTIVTPSEWIAGNVRHSFLKDYPIRVIPNGTDLSVFHPVQESQPESSLSESPDQLPFAHVSSALREELERKYGIPTNKKILLGVASAWNERKGMQVFRDLAESFKGLSVMPDDIFPSNDGECLNSLDDGRVGKSKGNFKGDRYSIVIVGMNAAQRKTMPSSIIFIGRTENREELAKLYSAAEILINPSLEESFSMVTVESLACGTPVIALDTSAVKELVPEDCGVILHAKETEKDPLQPSVREYLAAVQSIEKNLESGKISVESCTAQAAKYTEKAQIDSYMDLYRGLLN